MILRLLLAAYLAMALSVNRAHADERVEGRVLSVTVTYCDATRRGGCAGSLVVQSTKPRGGVALAYEVPLGTSIVLGEERVLLHTLLARRVTLTTETRGGHRIARAIQVEPE